MAARSSLLFSRAGGGDVVRPGEQQNRRRTVNTTVTGRKNVNAERRRDRGPGFFLGK
jgi:hypothetical protein